MIRILVADDNKGFCTMIETYVQRDETLEFVGVVHDGTQVLEAIAEHSPDVLLLDLVMPNRDGLEVLEDLAAAGGHRPKVMIMSAFGQDELVARATELGVNYYLMKPFSLSTLIKRIHQVAALNMAENGTNGKLYQQFYERISFYFGRIGVPPHYKGYRYLTEAVLLVCTDNSWLTGVTKHLYPEVGRRFSTSAGQVERAIRHALEMTWEKGNITEIERLFHYSAEIGKGKPTNSSFIAKMADIVYMDIQGASHAVPRRRLGQ